jgi:hypothetical protein
MKKFIMQHRHDVRILKIKKFMSFFLKTKRGISFLLSKKGSDESQRPHYNALFATLQSQSYFTREKYFTIFLNTTVERDFSFFPVCNKEL